MNGKNLIFLAPFVIIVATSTNITNLLPMIVNRQYFVIPERAQLNYVNTSLANVSVKMYIYNRTTKPLNMSFHFLTELTEESIMFVNVYQEKSNEYKLTATQFGIKIHQILDLNWFGIDSLYSHSVPPMRWPVKKGVTYRMSNWVPNSEMFPSMYAPVGNWMANTAWYLDNKRTKLFDSDYFFAIKERTFY